MGNKGSGTNKKDKFSDMTSIVKQYTPAFEKYKANPNYLSELMTQIPSFALHLKQNFPKAQLQFEAFFEMMMYLRREQKTFEINEYAKLTAPKTNLLDRYFLITLNLSFEDYEQKQVSLEQLDDIVIQYFKIFLQNPEKGSIKKILAFMNTEATTFKLKTFTDSFFQHFRSSIKYLKEFYARKFKKLETDGRLLKNFQSKIAKNDAIVLALKIPRLVEPQITQLYNIEKHGVSFYSLQKQLLGYTGPWLMLIQHFDKQKQGQKQSFTIGSYQNGPIKDVSNYQGDMTGFLFTIHPSLHFYTTELGDNDTKYFYLNNISNEKFNKRKGIGFGGDNDKKNFKLWIDEDIDKSYVFGGKDSTYGYGNLVNPGTDHVNIVRMEVWGLGHKYNLQDQKHYWDERQDQIDKRRKVDKKEFLGQNAGLFFQKTFAHRQQVVGEIQKIQKKQEDKQK